MSREKTIVVAISLLLLTSSCKTYSQSERIDTTSSPSPKPSTPSPNITLISTNTPSAFTATQEINATWQAEETAWAEAEATYWQLQTTTATPTPTLAPIATIARENDPFGISALGKIMASDENLGMLNSFSFTMDIEYYEWLEGSSYVYYLTNQHQYQFTTPGSIIEISDGSRNEIHFMTGDYGEPEDFHSEAYAKNGTVWCRNEQDDPWNDCDCAPGTAFCEDPVSISSISAFIDAARYSNELDSTKPFDYISSYFINPNEFITSNAIASFDNTECIQIVFSVDPYAFYKYLNGITPETLDVVFNRGSLAIDQNTDYFSEMNLQLIFKEPVPDDRINRNNHIEISFRISWDDFNQPFNYPDISQ